MEPTGEEQLNEELVSATRRNCNAECAAKVSRRVVVDDDDDVAVVVSANFLLIVNLLFAIYRLFLLFLKAFLKIAFYLLLP